MPLLQFSIALFSIVLLDEYHIRMPSALLLWHLLLASVLLSEFSSDHKLQAMAKELASAPIFPQGTNVELVCQDTERPLQIFYYERGVGRTLFSSTGSAAVFAVMQRLKKIHDSLSLPTSLGNIKISGIRKIYLENFCEIVYKGIYWK